MAEGDGVGELPQNIIGDQRLPLRVVRDKRMDMSLQEIGGDCHRSLLAHLRVAVRSKDRSCRTPRSSCRAGCVDIEPRNAVMPARSTASVRSAMSPPNRLPTPSFSQGAVPSAPQGAESPPVAQRPTSRPPNRYLPFFSLFP